MAPHGFMLGEDVAYHLQKLRSQAFLDQNGPTNLKRIQETTILKRVRFASKNGIYTMAALGHGNII